MSSTLPNPSKVESFGKFLENNSLEILISITAEENCENRLRTLNQEMNEMKNWE